MSLRGAAAALTSATQAMLYEGVGAALAAAGTLRAAAAPIIFPIRRLRRRCPPQPAAELGARLAGDAALSATGVRAALSRASRLLGP